MREKLKKIMGSNYFTITPEMVAPVEASGGNYGSFQVAADNEQKVLGFDLERKLSVVIIEMV